MVAWNKFEINDSGKVTINKIDETTINGLDVITLPSGIYFVDKEYLRKLTEFAYDTLKETPIYKSVGSNKEETEGIAIEVREIKDLNNLEAFMEEMDAIEDIKKFLS
jgi:hypothetical protein